MPTPFAVVALSAVVLGAVVGLVLWARAHRRRSSPSSAPGGREAPYSAEASAANQARAVGGSHPG